MIIIWKSLENYCRPNNVKILRKSLCVCRVSDVDDVIRGLEDFHLLNENTLLEIAELGYQGLVHIKSPGVKLWKQLQKQ